MRGDAGTPAAVRPRGRRRTVALATLLVLVGVAAAGCGSHEEGRRLAEPKPDQTTTTAAPGGSAGSGSGSWAAAGTNSKPALKLSSSAFADGATIPKQFTCRGADQSPPLQWGGVPEGTVELALVVRDVDIGGFVHWVIAAMDPQLGGIAQGAPPSGAVQANNAIGRPGYAGPCPPSGTHHYEFRLYALTKASGVKAGEAGAGAAQKVEKAPSLGSALLVGTASAT
jgi:Raf kinase inhibitor-like YbhB/YbcL family protein